MTTSEIIGSKPNKKEQASLQMQQRILTATINILGTEGFAAVTASNLSQKANISKGALYHHFANLDDIKAAALAALIDKFMEAAEPSEFQSLADYLAATGEMLFDAMWEAPVAMKAMYAFVMQALVEDSAKLQLQQLTHHALEQYQLAFQYFCPDVNPEQLAKTVQILDAYFAGATVHWFILDDPESCLSGWQLFSKILLRHLGE